jgi:hypothetical protein
MAEQASDRQSIVYVAGLNNSGSTWLSILLAQMENTANIGEVWYSLETPDQLAEDKYGCTCGATMAECEFWGPILKERESIGGMDLQHARVLDRFRETYPGKVMIDSSKFVRTLDKGWLSDKNRDQVDVKVIHIVRDYRGWANKRQRAYTAQGRWRLLYMHCVRWYFRNKAREVYLKKSELSSMTLSYESLVFNFKDELKRIADFTGLKIPENWGSIDPESLSLHMARGNSMRMDTAAFSEVRYDSRWMLDSRYLWLGPLLIPFHIYWKRVNRKK